MGPVNVPSLPTRRAREGGLLAGLDDLRARQLAESMGIRVIGTLGILVRAKQAGLIGTVRPLLDQIINQGFRLGPERYRDVLRLADEEAP